MKHMYFAYKLHYVNDLLYLTNNNFTRYQNNKDVVCFKMSNHNIIYKFFIHRIVINRVECIPMMIVTTLISLPDSS